MKSWEYYRKEAVPGFFMIFVRLKNQIEWNFLEYNRSWSLDKIKVEVGVLDIELALGQNDNYVVISWLDTMGT